MSLLSLRGRQEWLSIKWFPNVYNKTSNRFTPLIWKQKCQKRPNNSQKSQLNNMDQQKIDKKLNKSKILISKWFLIFIILFTVITSYNNLLFLNAFNSQSVADSISFGLLKSLHSFFQMPYVYAWAQDSLWSQQRFM